MATLAGRFTQCVYSLMLKLISSTLKLKNSTDTQQWCCCFLLVLCWSTPSLRLRILMMGLRTLMVKTQTLNSLLVNNWWGIYFWGLRNKRWYGYSWTRMRCPNWSCKVKDVQPAYKNFERFFVKVIPNIVRDFVGKINRCSILYVYSLKELLGCTYVQ